MDNTRAYNEVAPVSARDQGSSPCIRIQFGLVYTVGIVLVGTLRTRNGFPDIW
jgi:hypothetical protein